MTSEEIYNELLEIFPLWLEYEADARNTYPKREQWLVDKVSGLRAENEKLKAINRELVTACKRQVDNIERWMEKEIPAGPEESESIYEQLKAALEKAKNMEAEHEVL